MSHASSHEHMRIRDLCTEASKHGTLQSSEVESGPPWCILHSKDDPQDNAGTRNVLKGLKTGGSACRRVLNLNLNMLARLAM